MDGMESSVVLVVKAPNQQIEDQTVHCELGWTIKRLKGYLSEVYPSKPRLEDQKLIYSGQLLNDAVVLKDILRTYEGQKNHTLHLVCSPSRDTAKPTHHEHAAMSNTQAHNEVDRTGGNTTTANSPGNQDGLRHRTGQNVYTDGRPMWADPRAMWGGYAEAQASWSTMNATYDPAYVAQQMAWMQQAYAQYMTQYMQLITSGASITNTSTTPTVNVSPAPVPPATPPAPEHEEPADPNNVVPNVEAEEEEIRANRDWLEWFYILSRILVLFSIVYFYSSPVRFFMVATLGVIMYLYHLGFFRAMQIDRLDAQPEIPPAPADGVDNNNIEPAPNQIPAEESHPARPENDRPSLLALTWSVFSSFFLSLIPDQPNNVL